MILLSANIPSISIFLCLATVAYTVIDRKVFNDKQKNRLFQLSRKTKQEPTPVQIIDRNSNEAVRTIKIADPGRHLQDACPGKPEEVKVSEYDIQSFLLHSIASLKQGYVSIVSYFKNIRESRSEAKLEELKHTVLQTASKEKSSRKMETPLTRRYANQSVIPDSSPIRQTKKSFGTEKKSPSYFNSPGILLADDMTGVEFEKFCAGILELYGFTHVEQTVASGDDGVDILAVRNGESYAFQCKCYENKVSRSAVQEVYTGKTVYQCDHAVVITNSFFTEAAKSTASVTNVTLWDRFDLMNLLKPIGYSKIVAIARQARGLTPLQRR